MDRLPRVLADALGRRIRYGARVVAVELRCAGVTVHYREQSGENAENAVSAPAAIVAVPLTVLGNIRFAPSLPDERRSLAERVSYESAVRTFVIARRGSWLTGELSGFGWSEIVGEVWCRTGRETDSRGLGPAPGSGDSRDERTSVGAAELVTLVAYAQGERSRRLAALPPEQRVEITVEALDAMFPGLADCVVSTRTLCWDHDPWSRGAQARPWDVDPWPEPFLREPHGPVHFAGEHLASPGSAGWMDGALESGWTAAGRVKEQLGRG